MKESILNLVRPVFVLIVGSIIISIEFLFNAYYDICDWLFYQTQKR